jgi:uncharacterized protein (DUF1501 family)
MNFLNPQRHTRRAFLRRAGQLALAGTAAPLAINLAAMGEAAAFTATDYKALVCIFLTGGNDYANTVVPFDTASHAQYLSLRGSTLGTARALPWVPPSSSPARHWPMVCNTPWPPR